MKNRYSDAIGERISKILEDVTDNVQWEFVCNVLPKPDETLMVVACLMLFMPSPLLGQADLVHCGIIPDFAVLKSDDALRDTVFAGLASLRDTRAQIMGMNAMDAVYGTKSLVLPR